MISDVLSEAITEIHNYQRNLPGCYDAIKGRIDEVVAAMEGLRHQLEPGKKSPQICVLINAVGMAVDRMRETVNTDFPHYDIIREEVPFVMKELSKLSRHMTLDVDDWPIRGAIPY